MSPKIRWMVLVVLIGSSGILGYATLTNGNRGWGDDYASYILQAQSIVHGDINQFVEENKFTIEKSTVKLGPVAYPWGVPLLLAPLYKISGQNMLVLKNINLVSYILFLVFLGLCFHQSHSDIFLILFVSLFAFNHVMLASLNEVLSDIPFLFISTATVVLIGRVIVQKRPLISEVSDHLLLGTVIALSFFVRTNGLLLAFTAIGTQMISVSGHVAMKAMNSTTSRRLFNRVWDLLLSEPRSRLVQLSPYVVFAGIVLVWYQIFPFGEANHFAYFEQTDFRLVYHHINYYFEVMGEFLKGLPHSKVIYGATLPLFLAGVLNAYHRDYHMLIYSCSTALLYLLWPPIEGLRFILPLLPFYVHFVLIGVEWYAKAVGARWTRIARALSACALAGMALFFLRYAAEQAHGNIAVHRTVSNGPFSNTSQDMFSFIRENTPKDSVIVFFKPRAMRLFTNRRSFQTNRLSDLKSGIYLCLLKDVPRTVVSAQMSDSAIGQLGAERKLDLVYKNAEFLLYRVFDPAVQDS